MKIGIICGHGNGDPGACNAKYGTEVDFVRRLAPIIYRYLSSFASVEILDSSINWYVYLQSHYYDFRRFDYVIELHANAGVNDFNGDDSSTGIEIWVTDMEEAVTVEENILGSVSRIFDLRNRGVKIRDFLVITEIKRQGVSSGLIENGFLDDEDDMKIIFNHLDDYGRTIALAIAEGFGIA